MMRVVPGSATTSFAFPRLSQNLKISYADPSLARPAQTHKVTLIFLKLAFKTFEQGKSISSAACKSGKNFVVVKPAHFAGTGFGYDGAQGYLAISLRAQLECRVALKVWWYRDILA